MNESNATNYLTGIGAHGIPIISNNQSLAVDLIDYIFDNRSALSFWNSSSDNIPFWCRSAYFCNF